jgi:hypothetical protein
MKVIHKVQITRRTAVLDGDEVERAIKGYIEGHLTDPASIPFSADVTVTIDPHAAANVGCAIRAEITWDEENDDD